MRTPEKTWETQRLIAHPPAVSDAGVVFEQYASDPEVARFTQWRPHRDVHETEAFLERCVRCWIDGTAFVWSLGLRTDGSFVGFVEAQRDRTSVSLGYALVRRHWGRGLMTEAVRYLVGWFLAQPDIYRVWATCDIDNLGSARVLEHVGMHREGVLRRWAVHPNISESPRDCACYAIVKNADLRC